MYLNMVFKLTPFNFESPRKATRAGAKPLT